MIAMSDAFKENIYEILKNDESLIKNQSTL